MNAGPDSRGNRRAFSGTLWIMAALMVVSVAINYIDRGSLSTAGPLLKRDLKIDPAEFGWLLSAFFWPYAVLQIPSGWLVDRYSVKWVMAGGFLVWSLATAATGWVGSFGVLLGCRLLLGVGESVAYPCYSKIIAAHFHEHQRGLANGLIDAGTKLGPALGIFAGGMFMARHGWRPVFVVLGLGSLLWLPAWFRWMPRTEIRADDAKDEGPGFREIMSRRALWITCGGHFCGNYFWYFLLTWLPNYLVDERGFSMDGMAKFSAIAFCVTGVATTITGWLADRAIAKGLAPTRVRKMCAACGLASATVVIGVVCVNSEAGAKAFLILACVGYGVFASSHWAIPQTIAGPTATGKWSGLQNCVANMAGVVAPALTGIVVKQTGHFFWAFAAAAIVVLSGAVIYAFLLGPVEPIVWPARRQK